MSEKKQKTLILLFVLLTFVLVAIVDLYGNKVKPSRLNRGASCDPDPTWPRFYRAQPLTLHDLSSAILCETMKEPIISVSGLRGIVGESLDPLVAIRYTTAFIGLLDCKGPIVVTRDGRATGSMLAGAICSGISAGGREVFYGDIAATPTTGILVREHKAAGGIQISASHNPPPYNGIKLFGSDGRVIPGAEGERIIAAYREYKPHWTDHDQIGRIETLNDTTSRHLALVLDTVNVENIRSKKFKIVIDSNHGAGSILGQQLMAAFDCETVIIGGVPNGQFSHPPEPTENNLRSIVKQAIEIGADAVFCQDPDADRLAIIDETGAYIGEEYTLAITANHVLAQTPGPLVVNCSSSRMSADIARKYGCDFHISAVGEANVTDLMISSGAIFGGEGNGGPIDPRVGLVRDSFVGMAQVLDAMAAHGKTISGLVSDLPRYEIYKTSMALAGDKFPMLMDKLESHFPEAKPNRMDGLRLDWDDRWLLVRRSNTEPIVRAIAEAKCLNEAADLCNRVLEFAK